MCMLTEIRYLNFRNITDQTLKFEKGINIIVGDNAVGKTNLLEGIYYLAIGSTYLKTREENLVKDEEDFMFVKGRIKDEIRLSEKEISYNKKTKKKLVSTNGNVHKTLKDYVGDFPIIISSPKDLQLISDTPQSRRRLIDIEICQLDSRYFSDLTLYNKLLKIRNSALRTLFENGKNEAQYLVPLNLQLAHKATNITSLRREFLKNINKYIKKIYEEISGFSNLSVLYIDSGDNKEDDIHEMYSKFIKLYNKTIEKDIYYKNTSIGPHKDDLIFILDGKDMKEFASEGQKKLAMIAFKLAEIKVFEEKFEQTPLLLLDDIFGQIDIRRRNKLMKYLKKTNQVIITTNDLDNINEDLKNNAKIFKVTKEGIDEVKNGKSKE